jgi:tetratricopeptide (TPR) repeat protein
MAEVETKVQTVWEVVDHATSHIKNMTEAAERFKGVAERAKSVALGLFAYAGIEASVRGVVRFAEGLIRVNAELEKGRLNLGGMLWTVEQLYGGMGVRNFNEAVAKGAKLYEELEKHAAKAVGTTEDYTRALQAVLQPIAAAGGGLQEALEVAKLLVPTAQALNIPLEVASFSIKQALLGMLDARDMLVAQLGLQHEILNKLARQGKQAEVLKTLLEALRRNQELAAAAGGLWEARLATVEDIVKKIKRIMGEELFNAAKKTIDEFEKWFNKNEERIRKWARSVGTDLVNAFNKVVEATKSTAEHWEGIKSTIELLVEIWLAGKFVGAIKRIIGYVGQLRNALSLASSAEGVVGAGSLSINLFIGVLAAELIAGIERLKHNKREIEKADEWIEKAKKQAPWLYEEAIQYAESHKVPEGYRWLGGESQPDWEFVNYQKDIMKYIKEHWENTIRLSENFSEDMEKFMEELSQQSSILSDFFMSIRPQTFMKEITTTPRKPHPPVIDMRGSKIEIKMDVRHLDPDRVAAAVMTGLARAANRKIASKVPYPYLVSG